MGFALSYYHHPEQVFHGLFFGGGFDGSYSSASSGSGPFSYSFTTIGGALSGNAGYRVTMPSGLSFHGGGELVVPLFSYVQSSIDPSIEELAGGSSSTNGFYVSMGSGIHIVARIGIGYAF